MTIGAAAASAQQAAATPTIRTSGSRTCPASGRWTGSTATMRRPRRCSRPIRATSNIITKRSRSRRRKDRIPYGTFRARPDLQFLAGRGSRARHPAQGDQRLQLRDRKARVGHGARPRRAGQGGEGELGVEGRQLRAARRSGAASSACPTAAKTRSPSASSILRQASFVQGRVRPSQGQAERRPGWTRTRLLVSARVEQGRAWPNPAIAYIVKRLKRGQPLVRGGRSLPRQARRRRLWRTPRRPSRRRRTARFRSSSDALDTFTLGNLRPRRRRASQRVAIPQKAQPCRHGRRPSDRLSSTRTGLRQAAPRSFPGGIARLARPRAAQGRPGASQADADLCARPARGARRRQRVEGHAAGFDPRQCPRPDPAVHAGGRTATGPHQAMDLPDNSTVVRRGRQQHRRPGAHRRHQLPDAAVAVARRCRQRELRSRS